jgi:hypothetical protein
MGPKFQAYEVDHVDGVRQLTARALTGQRWSRPADSSASACKTHREAAGNDDLQPVAAERRRVGRPPPASPHLPPARRISGGLVNDRMKSTNAGLGRTIKSSTHARLE